MKKYSKKQKEQTTKKLFAIESKERLSSESIDELSSNSQLLDQYLKSSLEHTFSELLFRLTHERYNENKANTLWDAVVTHKHDLNKKLYRDVGILVATLDYLTNITGDIASPKIMNDQNIEEAAEVATRDALTGLYLRGVFDFLLKKEIARSLRYHTPLSLLMADIDNFKRANDHYGHQTGDAVLQQIGNIFLRHSRQADLPARYGGEEFAVILPETSLEEAFVLAERLRKKVFHFYTSKTPTVTVSIGVASLREGVTSGSELIKEADNALYAAKQRGKNTVVKGV